MSRIAIIDTHINQDLICCNGITHINVHERGNIRNNSVSHGTLCAMVLDHCTRDYEIVNIQIFENKRGKVYGNIDVLKKALQLCCKQKIDIISLSVATSILSDSLQIYSITKELSEKSIIVSALDNNDYVSIPASYPHVIGVRNDVHGIMNPGELAFDAKGLCGGNIYANCDFGFLRTNNCTPSNSFAVPVVTAYINNMINRGCSIRDIRNSINELPRYPDCSISELNHFHTLNRADVPIVVIASSDPNCAIRIINEFYEKYDVQATAVSLKNAEYDIRVKCIDNLIELPGTLENMKEYYKTDLIIVDVNDPLPMYMSKKIFVDVSVVYSRTGCAFIYNDITETVPCTHVAEKLYEVLTK